MIGARAAVVGICWVIVIVVVGGREFLSEFVVVGGRVANSSSGLSNDRGSHNDDKFQLANVIQVAASDGNHRELFDLSAPNSTVKLCCQHSTARINAVRQQNFITNRLSTLNRQLLDRSNLQRHRVGR